MIDSVDPENVLRDGIGKVQYVTHMGGDLATVNGARASYGTGKDDVDDKDRKLIAYLGDNIHQTPFRHTYVTLRIVMPIFVKLQWKTHMVGCEWGRFPDMPWSAFSQRYAEVPEQFYVPAVTRGQSAKNKQASGEAIDDHAEMFAHASTHTYSVYQTMLHDGVAREQARISLPTSTYTIEMWTASLQALVHFTCLRDDPHAQLEIQWYAQAVRSLVRPLAPHSWDALEASHPMVLRRENAKLRAQVVELVDRVARLSPP